MREAVFNTSVLDDIQARQRVKRERLRQQTLAEMLAFLDEFGSRRDLAFAIVFGSVIAPGRFEMGSDVDIAVENLEPAVFFDLMASLSLALGRDVDLIDLTHCHFADQIRQKGLVWTRKR